MQAGSEGAGCGIDVIAVYRSLLWERCLQISDGSGLLDGDPYVYCEGMWVVEGRVVPDSSRSEGQVQAERVSHC